MQFTSSGQAATGAPRWVLDSEVFNCQMCGLKFDTLKRKHHCRRCGGVFCKKCAPHRRLMPEGSIITVGGVTSKLNPRDPQRVCRTCQAELDPLQSSLCMTLANSIKENQAEKTGGAAVKAAFMEGFTLGAECRKSAYTVKNFYNNGGAGMVNDQKIPKKLLDMAQGIVFLHCAKAGFIVTGSIVGVGFQIGGEMTNYVLILTTRAAVRTFMGRGQVSLGAEIGVAVGPVGRSAAGQLAVGRKGIAPVLSYSHSKGFFAGVSLEGSVVLVRPDVNKNFYGVNLKPSEILSNPAHRPVAARPLYQALAEVVDDGTGVSYQEPTYIAPNGASAAGGQDGGFNFVADPSQLPGGLPPAPPVPAPPGHQMYGLPPAPPPPGIPGQMPMVAPGLPPAPPAPMGGGLPPAPMPPAPAAPGQSLPGQYMSMGGNFKGAAADDGETYAL